MKEIYVVVVIDLFLPIVFCKAFLLGFGGDFLLLQLVQQAGQNIKTAAC